MLVGDAFATSCPAAGTGARKVLVDVERLCNVHIPRWLETPGMGAEKIAAFYDDPVKQASDAYSAAKAYGLRSFTLDTSPAGVAKRWIKFGLHWGKGSCGASWRRSLPIEDARATTSTRRRSRAAATAARASNAPLSYFWIVKRTIGPWSMRSAFCAGGTPKFWFCVFLKCASAR